MHYVGFAHLGAVVSNGGAPEGAGIEPMPIIVMVGGADALERAGG